MFAKLKKKDFKFNKVSERFDCSRKTFQTLFSILQTKLIRYKKNRPSINL